MAKKIIEHQTYLDTGYYSKGRIKRMRKLMHKHMEQIECPKCGKRQMATVHSLSTWSCVHDCVSCNYTIMGSECVLINTEYELKQIELANEVDDDY